MTLECLHLAGASYSHHTQCLIEDSPTNRAALVEIMTLVGTRYDMSDRTAQWREEMVRFSAPIRHDTNDDIVSFVTTNRDTQAAGIRLDGYMSEGKLIGEVGQVRWSKKRSESYIAIHESLVAEFRRRFGDSVIFDEADHLLP